MHVTSVAIFALSFALLRFPTLPPARRRGITEAERREAPARGVTYVLDAASQNAARGGAHSSSGGVSGWLLLRLLLLLALQ